MPGPSEITALLEWTRLELRELRRRAVTLPPEDAVRVLVQLHRLTAQSRRIEREARTLRGH
jgi:hypothetical protein